MRPAIDIIAIPKNAKVYYKLSCILLNPEKTSQGTLAHNRNLSYKQTTSEKTDENIRLCG